MSEIQDLVLPVLQRIQGDIANLQRDVTAMKETLAEHTQRFEEMEIYQAYATGLASQNKADIQTVKAQVRTIQQRLDSLEGVGRP